MEQAATRPIDFEGWPHSAQIAYEAVLSRAMRAEQSLMNVQEQLDKENKQNSAPTDTLTWQTLTLRTMNDVFQEAATTLDPQQIFETVTRTVCQMLDATSVYVCDWNSSLKTSTVLAHYISEKANSDEKEGQIGEVYQLDSGFEAKLSQETWLLYEDDSDLSSYERRSLEKNKIKTALFVPMSAKDEVIGFLEIWDSRQKRNFQRRQLEFVTSIISQIGSSVRMAQLHRALEASEARFRLLMNTMQSGLVQVDLHGSILFTNEHFSNILAQNPDSLIGQNLENLWEQVAQSNRHEEARIVQANGNIIWLQVNRSQISSETGQNLGAVYIYTDISKRKEAEQQSIDLALEKERVHLLSEFVQDASHEFYTPLSVIKTQLYLLHKRLPEAVRIDEQITALNKQTQAIQNLVQALVFMTKLDSSRKLSLRPYKLNTLLEQLIDELGATLAAKEQKLDAEISTETLLVLCDAEKLHIAIKGILDNAHRYTPQKGLINIRLFHQAEKVIIEIQDTGIGMLPEVQERIFERFYREDQAHSTRGFGLGLSIAKRIVDLHQGNISVESQVGQGSIFRISLDRAY